MEGKIFYAKMDECVILKKLIETTKDIVSYLTFNISVIGIDVTTMDSSHVALVKFHLDPITFQEYMCSVDSITVTVDIRDIARTFKFHNPHDTVMLAISNTIGGLEVTFMKSNNP
jgi:DNA polymerase III sliding clamp (beta) subunit (PCNA family)